MQYNKKNILRPSIQILLLIAPVVLYKLPAFCSTDKLLWHPDNELTVLQFLRFSNLWIIYLFSFVGAFILLFTNINKYLRSALMLLVFLSFIIVPVYSGANCTFRLPSPLCALTKPFLFYHNGVTTFPLKFIAVISSILILSILGNKLFCGWACPIGSIQEFINSIPLNVKQIKPPFFWMNTVRVLLFLLSIPVILVFSRIIYDFLNPFAPIRWGLANDFLTIYSWIFLGIILILSLFIYRPYCYIFCPIGLITWIFEFIAPINLYLQKDKCDNCKNCIKLTSCPAVEYIIDGRAVRPDCYSCGDCIRSCPNDALKFGFKYKKNIIRQQGPR